MIIHINGKRPYSLRDFKEIEHKYTTFNVHNEGKSIKAIRTHAIDN